MGLGTNLYNIAPETPPSLSSPSGSLDTVSSGSISARAAELAVVPVSTMSSTSAPSAPSVVNSVSSSPALPASEFSGDLDSDDSGDSDDDNASEYEGPIRAIPASLYNPAIWSMRDILVLHYFGLLYYAETPLAWWTESVAPDSDLVVIQIAALYSTDLEDTDTPSSDDITRVKVSRIVFPVENVYDVIAGIPVPMEHWAFPEDPLPEEPLPVYPTSPSPPEYSPPPVYSVSLRTLITSTGDTATSSSHPLSGLDFSPSPYSSGHSPSSLIGASSGSFSVYCASGS